MHNYGGFAARARTKFRVSQLSRDVPLGRPDTHRTIFLEESAIDTKDCLIQLLDKYSGGRTAAEAMATSSFGAGGVERRTAFGRNRSRLQSHSFGGGGGGSFDTAGGDSEYNESTSSGSNAEQRSLNSLNFFFQQHAVAGNTVRQMQAQLESKRQA